MDSYAACPQLPDDTYKTPLGFLLVPYAAIPLSMLVVLVDQLFLKGWLNSHFLITSQGLVTYLFLSGLPHITASTVMFFDTEYMKSYHLKVVLPALLLVMAFLVFPALLFSSAFNLLFWGGTIIHVLGQQFGLTRLLGVCPNKICFFLWKWTGILASFLFIFGYFQTGHISPDVKEYLQVSSWLMFVSFLVLSCLVYQTAHMRLGRLYVIGNVLLISWWMVLTSMHYILIAALIPRLLHDVSAFIIYISHDANRNKNGTRNLIYHALNFSNVPVYILCPAISFLIALPIAYLWFVEKQQWAYGLFVFMTLMHYYTESFMWKRGSPQRRYVRF